RRLIPFADIAAIYLRTIENVQAVIVLRSGKKLYPYSSGTPRKTNRYCAAVKRIAHVGRVLPAERRARGKAGGDEWLPSVLVAALCGLVVAEMLLAEKLPHAINVALISVAVLMFLILIVLAVGGTLPKGGIGSRIREAFRLARAGICRNCGCATDGNVGNCPACGMRLRAIRDRTGSPL